MTRALPEDERAITVLLVDQIKLADVVFVKKVETVDQGMKSEIMHLVSKRRGRS